MHSFIVQLESKNGALAEAQVVQAHLGMSLEHVFNEIYDLQLEGRLRTGLLIVRLPVEQQWGKDELEDQTSERAKALFSKSTELAGAFDRVRDRSVHILTSQNGIHVLTNNLSPHWRDDPLRSLNFTPDEALTAIRKAELEFILDKSRAVLTSPDGSLYRTPSKRLVRSFVRVGNIQYNRDALDAIFFWLLPHLIGVGAILTDTWSISSIAFNIAKHSATYFGGETCRVEMLPSYDDGSEATRQVTRAVIERLSADCVATKTSSDIALCLISATQTGSLAKHINTVFSTSSLDIKPRFIAIFSLGDHDIPDLHDLSNDPRFKLEQEADQPNEPIEIDAQVYFPLRCEDSIFKIDKALADRSRTFFDTYTGAQIIEVHRDHQEDTGRPRHHAIHLATERLLSVPDFREKLEQHLSSLETMPQFIVCPPHTAGRQLAEYAKNFLTAKGHNCELFCHPNLNLPTDALLPEEKSIRNFLSNSTISDSLLVVDDVCITGTRLSQYQKYIRTERFKGRIDYLVGIARPPDPKRWNELQKNLRYRGNQPSKHSLESVEFVLLPDWHADACPWCKEKRLYEKWLGSGSLPSHLRDRLELLSRSQPAGLTEGIFLDLPNYPPMKIGPTSLFVAETANQAEVFASVAAALQYLRHHSLPEQPRLGPRRFPISTVLDHDDYLCSKWTDSILRATFLRAALADELTYADAEREALKSKALLNLLSQEAKNEHDITLEILLATAMKKCRINFPYERNRILDTPALNELTDYFAPKQEASDDA